MNPDLQTELKKYFGFSSFRPGQGEAIQSLLSGKHTGAVMPTGSGKSLIFQLAAIYFPVFILDHPDMPDGNRLLIQKGGVPFPHPFPEHFSHLENWLKEKSQPASPKPQQLGLL